mmetsp:Transcript_67194/g.160965  ORF Transcript_67194/g.160965 Transcript_67194/m.160965 type:complete len:885 (+) Transcript_67194:281-2935(+)
MGMDRRREGYAKWLWYVAGLLPVVTGVQLRGTTGHQVDGADRLHLHRSGVSSFEGVFRIRHALTGRYLDAYESVIDTGRYDYEVMTREVQLENVADGLDRTQQWVISPEEMGTFSLMQYSSGKFLDSREFGPTWWTNWTCYMRPADRFSQTQRWFVQVEQSQGIPNAVKIFQGRDNGRYLDSYNSVDYDFQVWLSEPNASSLSQVWVLEYLAELPTPLLDGLFIIKQSAVDRRLEAYEIKKDLGEYQSTYCLTRPREFSTDQRFIVRRLKGEVYEVTQQSTGLLLCSDPDGEHANVDYSVVTCSADLASEQQWILVRKGYDAYVIVHVATRRVLTAHESGQADLDYRAYASVPSLASLDGNISSQKWYFERIGAIPQLEGTYDITHKTSGSELTASSLRGSNLLSLLASGTSRNATMSGWLLQRIHGNVYSVQQNVSNQTVFLAASDAGLETALLWPAQLAPTADLASAMWYADWIGGDEFRLRQQSTGRYLTGVVAANGQLVVGTQKDTSGTNDTWTFTLASPLCLPNRLSACPAGYECGSIDDGCGGLLHCGNATQGACEKTNLITGEAYFCAETKVCTCSPLLQCVFDNATHCGGVEDDGCGGLVQCQPCLFVPPLPEAPNVTNVTNYTNTTAAPTLPPLTTTPVPNVSNVSNETNVTLVVPTWPEVHQLVSDTFHQQAMTTHLYNVFRFFYYFYYHFYFYSPAGGDLMQRAGGNGTLAMDMSARLAAVSAADLLKFAIEHGVTQDASGGDLTGSQILRRLGLQYPEVLPQGTSSSATAFLSLSPADLAAIPTEDVLATRLRTDPSLYRPFRRFGKLTATGQPVAPDEDAHSQSDTASDAGQKKNVTQKEERLVPKLPSWAPRQLQDPDVFGEDFVKDGNH